MAKSMPKQQPGRSVQDVRTPREFLAAARALLGIESFAVDLAATRENTVAPKFYSRRVNSLVQPWALGGWNWLNPEYADIAPWVKKAYEEKLKGAQTAVLIPAGVGANWWRDHVHGKAHVLLLNGRITFVGHTQPYPKDCALLVYAVNWEPAYRTWSWAQETRDTSIAERALRDVHVARLKGEQAPSRHLLHFDETTLRCLANGNVTATCQMKAREYIEVLDGRTFHEQDVPAAVSA